MRAGLPSDIFVRWLHELRNTTRRQIHFMLWGSNGSCCSIGLLAHIDPRRYGEEEWGISAGCRAAIIMNDSRKMTFEQIADELERMFPTDDVVLQYVPGPCEFS